jgi:hypothetical protein
MLLKGWGSIFESGGTSVGLEAPVLQPSRLWKSSRLSSMGTCRWVLAEASWFVWSRGMGCKLWV